MALHYSLIIDQGNSSTKMAVFEQERVVCEERHSENLPVYLKAIIDRYPIDRAIFSSVAKVDEEVVKWLNDQSFSLINLDEGIPNAIKNIHQPPASLGHDRLAAVVGACALNPASYNLVIDAGTAITYEYIDITGRYIGGNISPGLSLRLKALHRFTGRLPLIDKTGNTPEIGYDTASAIRSGVILGAAREIDQYIEDAQKSYPGVSVFLTGGDSKLLASKLKNVIFAEPNLVLIGLNRIVNCNAENK